MGVYSGYTNDIFDVIAKLMTDEDVIRQVEDVFCPEIGEIRMMSNATAPVNATSNTYSTNPAEAKAYYADGWIYPTGSYISEEAFPSAYRVFKDAGYATATLSGRRCVKIPYAAGFFKACGSRTPFQQNAQVFQMPQHKHGFNFTGGSSVKQTIPNATYIWETQSPTMDTSNQVYSDGHYVLHGGYSSSPSLKKYDIPVYPNGTSNETAVTVMKASDSNLQSSSVYPQFFKTAAMIYVGRPGK